MQYLDSDSSETEGVHENKQEDTVKPHDTSFDMDKTVISYCTSSGTKEPVHEPLSDPEPNSIVPNEKCDDLNHTQSSCETSQTTKPETRNDDTKQANSDSAIREQSKETTEKVSDTNDDKAYHEQERKNSVTDTWTEKEVHGTQHGNTVSTWKEWQKPQDIKSDADMLMLMNEFLCRKDVHACKCGTMFMDQTAFWLHKTNFHKQDNILACGGCRQVSSSQEALMVHLRETACFPKDN